MPAGNEAVYGDSERVTDVEGDAYHKGVVMETVALDQEVPDGDGQLDDTTEDMTSGAPWQANTEKCDGDAVQMSDAVSDVGTEAVGEPTDGNESPELASKLRLESLDGSTEQSVACGHSPEPGTVAAPGYKLKLQRSSLPVLRPPHNTGRRSCRSKLGG